MRVGPIEILVPPASREGRRLSEDQVLSTDAITSAPEDRSSRLPVPASRSRRPHVFPGLGKGALFGHCKRPRGLTRVSFERADAFVTRWEYRAWD